MNDLTPDVDYLSSLLHQHALDGGEFSSVDLTSNSAPITPISNHHHIGTPLSELKPDSVFRLYCCNPNGLKPLPLDNEWTEFLRAMHQISANAICLTETNVDFHQPRFLSFIQQASSRIFDHRRLSTACSPIPTTTYFKPGGVALLTTESTTGRVIATGSDEMGRWTYQSLLGCDKRQITIISAYQVCSPSSSQSVPSALTAHLQQVSILRRQHRHLSPRQSFVTDLTQFIKSLQIAGHGIILAGDFNEPLGYNSSGMTKLCTDCDLADLLFHMIGQGNFKTWQRGTDRRIDYVLCSDWIVETAVSACYEPFQFRSKGDHRNICIDFDLLRLLGNPMYRIASPSQREFSAKDRRSVATYLTVKHEYLLQHNFFQQLDQLTQHWDPALAEQLDRDFQRASVTAANACVREPNLPYVHKLARLRQEKNVLRRILSQSCTGQSLSASIAHLTTEGHSFRIPASLEACQERCRAIQREIHDMQKRALSSRKNEQLRQIEDANARGDRKTAKIIRHIMAAERTKAL